MTNEETLLNVPTEIKEALYGENYDNTAEAKFNYAIINKTEDGLTYHELWILVNAYYDYTNQRFVKIDLDAASFGVQLQGKGTYPGEHELGYDDIQGINFWRNPIRDNNHTFYDTTLYDYTDTLANNWIGAEYANENVWGDKNGTWRDFGISSGWNNNFMTDSNGGITVGGSGFEIDGNGIMPFIRVTSSRYYDGSHAYYLTGMIENAYHPSAYQIGSTWYGDWDCDSNEYGAFFFGLRIPVDATTGGKDTDNAKFVVMYNDMANASVSSINDMNAQDWKILFETDNNSVKGLVNGSLLDLGDYNSLKNKPAIPIISDSGWLELTVNPNFYNYTENSVAVLPLQYRKVGSLVQIIGLIGLNANLSVGQWTIGTLPEGCRPSKEMSFVCELNNNSNLWTCIVKTTGEITFNRLRDDTGFIAGAQWVDCLKLNVMFII